jgi:hypothetical protein
VAAILARKRCSGNGKSNGYEKGSPNDGGKQT